MIKKIYWIALLLVVFIAQMSCTTEIDMPDFELTQSEWWVEDINGKGVIDNSHTTLQFLEKGTVGGDTACNRYHGSLEITGSSISFGPMAGTRKACSPVLMDQEMKFYQAIAKVVTWEVAVTGLLHLKDADGNDLIRAWRVGE